MQEHGNVPYANIDNANIDNFFNEEIIYNNQDYDVHIVLYRNVHETIN